MSFKEWLFETGEIQNPFYAGQWKFLHILTLIICVATIIACKLIANKSKDREKTVKIILSILIGLILFFEIASRIVHIVRRYYYNVADMQGLNLVWIILPKPWCAISCWALIASLFVNKKFFYNYASLSALLCSVIFFIYPGVGFNNKYIMFSNLYSITTHALLLSTSILLMVFNKTEFKYHNIGKVGISFALTFVYGLLEIFVLKIQTDPMYFMPHGDIQEGILGMPWIIYIVLYTILILIYINAFYLINDKENVKKLFKKSK